MVTAGSGSGRKCLGGEVSTVSLVSLFTSVSAAVLGAGAGKAEQKGTDGMHHFEAGQKRREVPSIVVVSSLKFLYFD